MSIESNTLYMKQDSKDEDCNDELEYWQNRCMNSIKKRYGLDGRPAHQSRRDSTEKRDDFTRDEELEYLSNQALKNFTSIKNKLEDEELEKMHEKSLKFLEYRDAQKAEKLKEARK